MAIDQEVGEVNIRAQFFDGVVKGFATASYKFKQAVNISPTSAWKNFFYRESPTALAGATGNTIEGIPRGAEFPQAVVQWERIQAVIKKYGLEDNIHWEDILTSDVDVQERTLFRIAEGVTKAVDDEIWDVLTESRSPSAIQSVTLVTGGRGSWNETSAAIIDDLLEAKQKMAEQNYDVSNTMLFISPRDYRSIMKHLTDKGAQFPSLSTDIANNGVVGTLAGTTLVVSNSVTTSYALMVIPKRVGTWKELVPLQTTTKEDPYKSVTIRAVEMGTTQLTDPKAAVLIIGTQHGAGIDKP